MSITANNQIAANSSVAGTTFTTAAVGPGNNAVVLFTITSNLASGNGAVAPSTVVFNGTGLTFSLVASAPFGVAQGTGTQFMISTWQAVNNTNTAIVTGTITVTYSVSQTRACWILDEVEGVSTGGSVVVQAITGAGSSVSPTTVTMGAFSDVRNATYVASCLGAAPSTPSAGTGLTLLRGVNALFTNGTAFAAKNITTPQTTWTGGVSQVWGEIGIELLYDADNIKWIKSGSAGKGSTAGTTFTMSPGISVGDRVVVGVAIPSATVTVSGITDTPGNTYAKFASVTNGALDVELWMLTTLASGNPGTLTVTLSASGTLAAGAFVVYNGSIFAGQIITNTGTSATATGSMTTVVGNDVYVSVGGIVNANTWTQTVGQLLSGSTATGVQVHIMQNTSSSPSSLATTATVTSGAWAVVGLELRLFPIIPDALTESDFMQLGYGDQFHDQLVFNDGTANMTPVIGLNIQCPHLNNWLDAYSQNLAAAGGGAITLGLSDDDTTWLDFTGAGYGSATSDQIIIVDSLNAGYGGLFSDTLTLTDAEVKLLGMNDSFTDAFTFADFMGLGYGDQTSDAMGLTDSAAYLFTVAATFTDTMTMSDFMSAGYGNATSDQLILTDSLNAGYGGQFTDTMTLTDAEKNILGMNEVFTDTETMSDFMAIGYGNVFTDVLSLSDTTGMGYGNQISDTLSMSEFIAAGYGDVISDTMTMTDSEAQLLSIAETFSDTMTMSDFMAAGYGNIFSDVLSLSDTTGVGYGDQISDTLTMSDSISELFSLVEVFTDTMTLTDSMLAGYGNATSDQIILVDSIKAGYGGLFTDTMTLSDAEMAILGTALVLADTDSTWLDFMAAGYGNATSDQLVIVDSISAGYGGSLSDSMTMSDSEAQLLSIALTLSDNDSTWLDSLGVGYGNAFKDTMALSDSLSAGYGNATSDQIIFVDSIGAGYGGALTDTMTMTDSEVGLFSIAATLSDINTNFADSLAIGYGDLINDQLSLSDVLSAGYGSSMSDQIVLVDSISAGYGDVLSDTMTMSDSEANLLGLIEVLTDSDSTWLDSLKIGYGDLFSDTMSMSDSLTAGYGSATSDQIVLVDSMNAGYGDVLSDTMTMSDSEAQTFGLTETLTDSDSTWLDSMALGYGNVITDVITFTDTTAIGYGMLISDNEGNNWFDTLTLSGGGLTTLSLFDNLNNWLDFLAAGYGSATSDQIVIVDSMNAGYGDLLNDNMSLSDSELNVLGMTEKFTDTETLTDFMSAGYGNATSDQLILTDSLNAGYGGLFSDTLTLNDFTGVGYGDLISDQMTMTDSMLTFESIALTLVDNDSTWLDFMAAGYGAATSDQIILVDSIKAGYGGVFSDSLTQSDTMGLGYGDVISDIMTMTDSELQQLSIALTLTDNDSTWLDSLRAGYGVQFSDQVVIVDSLGAGYGDVLSDNLNNWQDAFSENTGSSIITLALLDALNASDFFGMGYGSGLVDPMALADFMALGYGDLVKDTMTLTDVELNVLGMNETLTDNDGSWSDTLAKIEGDLMNLNDALSMLDSLGVGHGIGPSDALGLVDTLGVGYGLATRDSFTLSDFINPFLETALEIILSDSDVAWLDNLNLLLVGSAGPAFVYNVTNKFVLQVSSVLMSPAISLYNVTNNQKMQIAQVKSSCAIDLYNVNNIFGLVTERIA